MKNLVFFLSACAALAGYACCEEPHWTSASYRASGMPRVYMTYAASKDFEGDISDLRAHGVDAIEWARGGGDKTNELAVLRRYGMKAVVWGGEFSRNPAGVERHTGRKVTRSRCIGGAYRGLDIGRHVFSFTAEPHVVVVEPPRRNAKEYFPGFVPVAAEVVVPLKVFDGEQHLKIISATFREAAEGAVPENDTAEGDAIFWFGYTRREGKVFGICDLTFPNKRPESWERTTAWHAKIAKELPPKPVADIAVLRSYAKRAICIPAQDGEKGVRHPADRKLQSALSDLAVKGGHYDVFEVPPVCCESDAARAARDEELKKYKRVIRTEDFE